MTNHEEAAVVAAWREAVRDHAEACAFAITRILPGHEKLVLLVLAASNGWESPLLPSVEELAAETGLTTRFVRSAAEGLAAKGFLSQPPAAHEDLFKTRLQRP